MWIDKITSHGSLHQIVNIYITLFFNTGKVSAAFKRDESPVSNLATVIPRGCSRMEGALLPAMRLARRTSKDKEEKEGVTSRADKEDFAIFHFFQSPLSKDLLTATACFTLSPDH